MDTVSRRYNTHYPIAIKFLLCLLLLLSIWYGPVSCSFSDEQAYHLPTPDIPRALV